MKTMKKYNIGSPKRPGETNSKTVTRTIYKKHNIGPPEKVIVTPDTPKSKIWKQIREKSNYKSYEIGEYDEDDDDKVLESTFKPTSESIFTPTKFTKHALIKKPFRTRMGAQVHENDEDLEKEWSEKLNDSPNKLHLEPRKEQHRQSRTKSRSRSRSRGRGRGRGRSRRNRG